MTWCCAHCDLRQPLPQRKQRVPLVAARRDAAGRAQERFPKKFAEYVSIAGVSYRQQEVAAFIEGHNRQVFVRREVALEGRPPSLAVYGTWEDWAGGMHEALLGYIPKEVHETIGDMPIALTLEAMYQAAGKKRTAGLRVDIWQPRSKKPVGGEN